MDFVQAFLGLSLWAFEATIWPPFLFVSLAAAISLFQAERKQLPFETRLWKPYYWLVLTHLAFFVAAITVGVAYQVPLTYPVSSRHLNPRGTQCLQLILFGSFLSCAFWVWRMKRLRWFAASLVALMETPVLAALSMAGMAVTGNWL